MAAHRDGDTNGNGPKIGQELIVHATTVVTSGRAVLIQGAAGSGKSGLALQLLALGAALVADDRTRLWRGAAGLMADAPTTISGLIEARGMGLLKAPAAGAQPLALVVDMDRYETKRLPPPRATELLGLSLPLLHQVDSAYFPAAVLLYLTHGRHA